MFGYATPVKNWNCMDVLSDCCASFGYTERKVVDTAEASRKASSLLKNLTDIAISRISDAN